MDSRGASGDRQHGPSELDGCTTPRGVGLVREVA